MTGVSTRAHLASRDTEHRVNNIDSTECDEEYVSWCLQVNLLPYKIECSSENYESDDTIGAEADEIRILPVIVVTRI